MYYALVIRFLKGRLLWQSGGFHVGSHHVAKFTHRAAEDEDFVINLGIYSQLLEPSCWALSDTSRFHTQLVWLTASVLLETSLPPCSQALFLCPFPYEQQSCSCSAVWVRKLLWILGSRKVKFSFSSAARCSLLCGCLDTLAWLKGRGGRAVPRSSSRCFCWQCRLIDRCQVELAVAQLWWEKAVSRIGGELLLAVTRRHCVQEGVTLVLSCHKDVWPCLDGWCCVPSEQCSVRVKGSLHVQNQLSAYMTRTKNGPASPNIMYWH